MSNPEQPTPDVERGEKAVFEVAENVSPVPSIHSHSVVDDDNYADTDDDDNDGYYMWERNYIQSNARRASQTTLGYSRQPLESREAYRMRILAILKNTRDNSKLGQLGEPVCVQRLLQLAELLKSKQQFEFFRFERLALLNLLYQQHKLIEYDENLRTCQDAEERESWYSKYKDVADITKLSAALQAYCDAIQYFKTLSKYKQPDFKPSRRLGRRLAKWLNEPRYWESPDALNLIDLTRDPPQETDRFRRFLQRKIPTRLLDKRGREQRHRDNIGDAKTPGDMKMLNLFKRQPRHLSPIVDKTARIGIAIVGGVFLLAPMVVLAYVANYGYQLLTTVLFVLFFALLLGLVSKASNQELLGATAAYAAVLVVFVAGSSA